MKFGDLANGTVTIDQVIEHVKKKCEEFAAFAREQAAKKPKASPAEIIAFEIAKHDPNVN